MSRRDENERELDKIKSESRGIKEFIHFIGTRSTLHHGHLRKEGKNMHELFFQQFM